MHRDMTVYEAIREMRRLSALKKPFAMSYMSYSDTRHDSHGEVEVEHALLVRNQKTEAGTPGGEVPAQDVMLTYRDQDTGEARHFWQPLLMSFNHEPLTSID